MLTVPLPKSLNFGAPVLLSPRPTTAICCVHLSNAGQDHDSSQEQHRGLLGIVLLPYSEHSMQSSSPRLEHIAHAVFIKLRRCNLENLPAPQPLS